MFNEGGMAAMGGGMGAEGDFDMYGGIDPSMDPELAMAIRISQEEAKAAEDARVRVSFAHRFTLFIFVNPYTFLS